jgi:hypothetical protein
MKQLILPIALILASVSCDPPPDCECQKVINIQPYGATRANITVQCLNGKVEIFNLHWSNNFACDGRNYYMRDYLPNYGNKTFDERN